MIESEFLKALQKEHLYLVGIKMYDGATFTVFEIYARFKKSYEKKKYQGPMIYEFETEYSQIPTSKIKKLYESEMYHIKDAEGIDILELENFAQKPLYKINE